MLMDQWKTEPKNKFEFSVFWIFLLRCVDGSDLQEAQESISNYTVCAFCTIVEHLYQ